MSNKTKHKGAYNARARREHPGVKILKKADGRIVIRYKVPGSGRETQEALVDSAGLPIKSKARAGPIAERKSEELSREYARRQAGLRPVDGSIDWDALFTSHKTNLVAEGRRDRTLRAYKYAWEFFEQWPDRPGKPHLLTALDLKSYMAFVRSYKSAATKAPLSMNSVASLAFHTKAILNYGRRYLSCIKLDGEAVGLALRPGRLPKPSPVALSSTELQAILDAALRNDLEFPSTKVFPFLAFLMMVGCRRGDAERFRFAKSKPDARDSWIDFDGGTLQIWAAKVQRHVPVPLEPRTQLRTMLERLRDSTDVRKNPFVFGGHKPLAIGDRRAAEMNNGERGHSGKYALARISEWSSVDFSCKDLRSTLATYMANSALGGKNLLTLSWELGHEYPTLLKFYVGQKTLPPAQRDATNVADLLGIGKQLDTWLQRNS
ncbi:MAG: site-specific integrase [Planctomycetes bacterium]|nr:site-specific integrase [Planctomycetota bacterium]